MKSNKTPKLRFKEFTDEWQEKKLRDFFEYKNGGSFEDKINPNGKYKLINLNSLDINGHLQDNHKKVIETDGSLKQGDLIMVLSDIAHGNFLGLTDIIPDNDYVLNQRMAALKPRGIGCTQFLRYYINKNQKYFKRHGQGTSQLNLSKGDVEKFPIFSPSKPEQQKIADFLGAVDEKIGLLEKKGKGFEKYKNGVMQKLFPKKGETNPELRFRDESGEKYPDWEEKRFSDLLASMPTKKYQIYNNEIEKSGDHPVVDQGQNKIAGYSNIGSKLFRDVPVIVFGDHTTFLKYIDFNFVIGADGTKILKNKHSEDSISFLYYALENNPIEPEGYRRHFSILKNRNVNVPDTEEQQKIADFLTLLDDKVDLVNKELEQAKLFKKALLQQMFV